MVNTLRTQVAAFRALQTYAHTLDEVTLDETPVEEVQTAVVDLLADLHHLCDNRAGLDFDKALESASIHYAAEVSDSGA